MKRKYKRDMCVEGSVDDFRVEVPSMCRDLLTRKDMAT